MKTTKTDNIKNFVKNFLAEIRFFAINVMNHSNPKVNNVDVTIDKLVHSDCSIIRFGDGETALIRGHSIRFQDYHEELKEQLVTILKAHDSNLMIGIPDIFSYKSIKQYKKEEQGAWKRDLLFTYGLYRRYCRGNIYYSSLVSRLYMPFNEDYSTVSLRFDKIKRVWEGKHLLIIEGERTRFGVGNNLLDGCLSIERILGPGKNAYSVIPRIEKYVTEHYSSDDVLVISAMGPAAKLICYDLFLKGFRCLDLGHLDIEYEWYTKAEKSKVAILGKAVNEVQEGAKPYQEIDDKGYNAQIVFHLEEML